MRGVTDNRTGELEVGEVKRGRGRPRKPDAMTNAQRQAAYRARHRQAVTVTKNPLVPRLIVSQVDAYDECRIEVDALRAELAEAREKIEGLSLAIEGKHRSMLVAERERDEALAREGQAWGCVNEARELVKSIATQKGKLQLELDAAKQGSKAVTRNKNPIPFSAMLDLLCLVSKARTKSDLLDIRETDLWRDQVVCSDADYEAVWGAVARERKVVTRKV